MKRYVKNVWTVLVCATVLSGMAVVGYAECNRTEAANFQSSENTATCVYTTIYNRQCVKPVPDDWSQGCTESNGLVRKDTWNGTKSTWKLVANICSLQFGVDCSTCVYTGNPTTTQVSGTITTLYTCGG